MKIFAIIFAILLIGISVLSIVVAVICFKSQLPLTDMLGVASSLNAISALGVSILFAKSAYEE